MKFKSDVRQKLYKNRLCKRASKARTHDATWRRTLKLHRMSIPEYVRVKARLPRRFLTRRFDAIFVVLKSHPQVACVNGGRFQCDLGAICRRYLNAN